MIHLVLLLIEAIADVVGIGRELSTSNVARIERREQRTRMRRGEPGGD